MCSSDLLTRPEIESCLRDFATFLQAEKRMYLWKATGSGEHKWVSRPEKHVQSLLHTFIKGRLAGRVEVFEEIAAGAGRLDIYLVAMGGFATVIELKMLGGSYSSTYAFSGTEQIAHYMENKRVGFGYLVIADARSREFGTGIESPAIVGQATIDVIFVDVRPTVDS